MPDVKIDWRRPTTEGGRLIYDSKCRSFKIVRLSEGTPYDDSVYALYPLGALADDGKGYATRSLTDAKILADRIASGSKPEDVLRLFAKPCRHNPKGGLGRTIPMNPEVPRLPDFDALLREGLENPLDDAASRRLLGKVAEKLNASAEARGDAAMAVPEVVDAAMEARARVRG